MARPCGIAVDGSAALTEDTEHGLAVVPLRIMLGETEFIDSGDTAGYASFYDELRRGGVPATSTPSPGEYLAAFERTGAEHVVCLTLPARWSAMHGAATLAATMFAEQSGSRRATVIDTGTAIGGLALVARAVAERCAVGDDAASVIAAVDDACRRVRLFGALATLTYVARSGRVNSLIAGISNSLHVRPVFRLQAGDTGRVALTRTATGAVDALLKATDVLERSPQWVLVFHADAAAEAGQLSERLTDLVRPSRCEIVALSPVGGAYTGPGAFGFAALPLTPAAA